MVYIGLGVNMIPLIKSYSLIPIPIGLIKICIN